MAVLSGVAKVFNEGAASKVFAWNWTSGALVGSAEPDAQGAWSITVPSGTYGVTIRGVTGVWPASLGPYEVS